jgi:hypothetical protein
MGTLRSSLEVDNSMLGCYRMLGSMVFQLLGVDMHAETVDLPMPSFPNLESIAKVCQWAHASCSCCCLLATSVQEAWVKASTLHLRRHSCQQPHFSGSGWQAVC